LICVFCLLDAGTSLDTSFLEFLLRCVAFCIFSSCLFIPSPFA
jgi:hypothetical protein